MPVPTRRELQDRINELEAENDDLQSRLDDISDIVTGDDEGEDYDDGNGDDDNGDDGNGETDRLGGIVPRSVCGASWRKAAHQITDRAKRYRANAPECCPPLPRKCALCSSRRFVVVDHIDGDESNGSPQNLRWLCRAATRDSARAMRGDERSWKLLTILDPARADARAIHCAWFTAQPRPPRRRRTDHPRNVKGKTSGIRRRHLEAPPCTWNRSIEPLLTMNRFSAQLVNSSKIAKQRSRYRSLVHKKRKISPRES